MHLFETIRGGRWAGTIARLRDLNRRRWLAGWLVLLAVAAGRGRAQDTNNPGLAGSVAEDGRLAAVCPIQVTRESSGNFTITNHFQFTDTKDCTFTWQLRQYGLPTETNPAVTVLREGMLGSPAIPPGGSGLLEADPAADSPTADALALRVNDPAGHELWTWVWTLTHDDSARLPEDTTAWNHALPQATNDEIQVVAGDLMVTFSPATGRLLRVARGGQTYSLTNGPQLTATNSHLREIHFTDDGPDAVVSAKFDGELKSIVWRVNGNGWVDCDYDYITASGQDLAGVTFDYPAGLVRHWRWLGDGPYRASPNQNYGAVFGRYESDGNPVRTGGPAGGRSEFTGRLAGVRWLQLETVEGPITILNRSHMPWLQAPVPTRGTAEAGEITPGLAFWDSQSAAIPVKPPGQTGEDHQNHSGQVSFFFGKSP